MGHVFGYSLETLTNRDVAGSTLLSAMPDL
jgi:hypothetical protein